MEAKFATPESTAANYRVEYFKFWKKNKYKFSENFFEKNTENVISQKLQGLEQSYFETKFATPGKTLTEPHYRDENFKFSEIFYI